MSKSRCDIVRPDPPDQAISDLRQGINDLKILLEQQGKESELQQQEIRDQKILLEQQGEVSALQQQEINLLKILLEQQDKELALERSLWKSRGDKYDASKKSALHRQEVLDDIIYDEDKLHQSTLADGPKFQYILERARMFLEHSGQMPLFRDDDSRTSDPGNRCKLYLRHALLMVLIHKKDNPTQGTLAAFFGIDQTTVSRYLPVMDRMLAETLPTAKKI